MLGDGLAVPGELLPLGLIDRLEAQRMIVTLRQIGERRSDRDILTADVAPTREARVLLSPRAWRSQILISAQILKVRLVVLAPIRVPAVDPLLLGEKRIV